MSRQVASWQRYRIRATLQSDTHLGSGTGGAGIDALVAKDRFGRPVVWASHLEGVLRDAARRPRNASAAGDDAMAAELFGRPRDGRGAVLCSSLYTDSDVLCRVWRSSARKAFDNRAPLDDTLRVTEYVPAGTIFEGLVEIRREHVDVFRRLLSDVDAIGGGRASNTGNVYLQLIDLEPVQPRSVHGKGRRLRLLLLGVDPICIAATATPGNIVPTAAYIPGRTLVGAVAAWLHNEGRTDAATALVSGALSVGDAHPLPRTGEVTEDLASIEVLPAPLSLQRKKPVGRSGALPWWSYPAVPAQRIDVPADKNDGTYKRPEPDLFVGRTGSSSEWTAFRPSQNVRLRNGRASAQTDEPQLFATEYLAEKTIYLVDITADESVLDDFCVAADAVLDGRRWLRVGRGGAPVEVVRAQRLDEEIVSDPGDSAIMTLTSDLLVRDDHLNWATAIGNGAAIPGMPEGVIFEKGTVQEHIAIHGFNGTSRMWRRPMTGIRRGSTFRVTGKGLGDLAAGAAHGRWLGEQTALGFGRYRVDRSLPGVTGAMTTSAPPRETSPDDPDEQVVATTRAWLDDLRELIPAGPQGAPASPSLSQWFDLVAELGTDGNDAIVRREHPETAGAQIWSRSAAAADALERIKTSPDPHAYAETFLRWLRANRPQEDA